MNPFLRWAGSKRRMLPLLRQFWSNRFVRYIEPFVGSAALYFDLLPERAILTDLNHELINTYRAVRNRPTAVWKAYSNAPISRPHYYRKRAQDPANLSATERAARFIYLNRFCFNGIYRTNLEGQFNVPYGAAKSGELPTCEQLKAISKVLRCAEIEQGDFEEVIAGNVRRGDFVYLDPPFARHRKRVFREYGPKSFAIEDLERLGRCLFEIDSRGGHFVLSYGDSSPARAIASNWNSKSISIQRNVAGFSKNRRKDRELIISNLSVRDVK